MSRKHLLNKKLNQLLPLKRNKIRFCLTNNRQEQLLLLLLLLLLLFYFILNVNHFIVISLSYYKKKQQEKRTVNKIIVCSIEKEMNFAFYSFISIASFLFLTQFRQ
jgi:hypothetical protein